MDMLRSHVISAGVHGVGLEGGPYKNRLFLRVDNFEQQSARDVIDMSFCDRKTLVTKQLSILCKCSR